MKKKKSPLVTLLIIFAIILFFGLMSSFFPSDNFNAVPFHGDKVGIIKVEGVIFDSQEILRQLEEFEENRSVKAIVIRIDSPGGSVAPSQEIFHEILRLKKIKKIVTSMGAVAASGGYYIACATDEIYANSGSITGSIGVIMEIANFESLLDKIGISSMVVKSGKFKDIGNPTRKMTEEELDYLQMLIMDIYEQFVEDISTSRNIPKEKVYPIADGRILTGRMALKENLIDKIGTIKDAVKRAGELAGIKGKPEVIYPKKKRLGVFDMFLEETKSYIDNLVSEKKFSVNYMMTLPNK